MKVFTCYDTIESILTSIYTAWEYALMAGHNNVRLIKSDNYEPNLIEEYELIEGDYEKAQKVSRSIIKKISYPAYTLVFYCMLSCEKSAIDDIYRFLNLGFKVGDSLVYDYNNPVVHRLHELKRNVSNEACSFREFVRFNLVDESVYVSHIEPKNNIAAIVGNHFTDRMPSEYWMIIDDTRNIAIVHPKDEDFYIRVLTKEEAARFENTNDIRDEYTVMWKTFFDAIAIRQRINPVCQRNLFPIWKRKNAVEFS